MPDLYTNFPISNPFYGGLTLSFGTGQHVDRNEVTGQEEYIRADYLNRLERRIQRAERFINQIEHEILYPSGRIATSGYADETPASGNYYLNSRLDRLASGVNRLIQQLVDEGNIPQDTNDFYPFSVGDM